MSAKPTSLPIWATDAAAQVTEPNLAKKQQGHLGGEPLFGDYENWWKNLVYRWAEYLRDGVLAGVHQFLDAVTFSALATFNAGLAAAANQHIAVSGTGRYKHGTRTKVVNGADAFGTGFTPSTEAIISLTSTLDRAFYGVPIEVGKRLTAIRVHVFDNATGPTTVTATLFSSTGSIINSTGFTATSAGNATVQTLTISGINLTLATGTRYVLRCTVSANNSCQVRMVEFDYDEP